MQELTVALAGNPNVGKSTLFNALTGARQHVGNWPGKTVEKREGTFRCDGVSVTVVDLPGTYSLSAYSPEEEIARSYIVRAKPDVVVNVVDAANLERNLYLTAQILETGIPLVLVLNMGDVAVSRGLIIDVAKLSELLNGAPVIPMTARSGKGIETLRLAMAGFAAGRPVKPAVLVKYSLDIEEEIARLEAALQQVPALAEVYPTRWLAIQLLEGDPALLTEVRSAADGSAVTRALETSRAHLCQHYGGEVNVVVADFRYGFVHGLAREVLTRTIEQRITNSDRIDRVVTHRLLGIPIFLAFMWVVFKVTTDVAGPYVDWLNSLVHGPLTRWVIVLLELVGLGGSWVQGLLVDGIIAGVGGVVIFIPILMSLYLLLAFLEDSGYMARGAFVMDNLMHLLGLHGKSFLPMLLGFGCTVPALYATRTLDSEKDRMLTGLLVPFMSCGARLPVYVLFATIFFPNSSGMVIFALYLAGIAVAILLGIVFKHTLFRDYDDSPFVMELPPYRMPTLRSIWFHMWEHTASFLRRVTTVVLLASVVIWLLMAVPLRGTGQFGATVLQDSTFAVLAEGIAPVLAPLGFGSWENSTALITGLVAKEVVISTLAQVHSVSDDQSQVGTGGTFFEDVGVVVTGFIGATLDTVKAVPLIVGIHLAGTEEQAHPTQLMAHVRASFAETSGGHAALAAVAFMVFVLLYTPCVVAVSTGRQELGTRWLLFSVFGQISLAWVAAFLVFQGGRLLGLG
jgi:ferrous iron transport protein B